jgi:signal peptidase II
VTRGPFKWPFALAVGVLIVILDQWSKHAITAAFRHGEVLPVTSFFNLVMVHNAGAAFSFLSDASGWQRGFFIGITALAMAVIVWMMRRHREELLFCWGLAFVAAGAVGNLVDRVSYGYVIDFLDFHAAGWHFWAFNLADSAITLGAGLLILDSFRPRKSS